MPVKPAEQREEVLFREARQRPKGPEREAYLDQACAGNEALRHRLAVLLQADESPDPFLEPQGGDLLDQMTTLPAPDFTVEGAGARIGRYKLLEKIGEGGCGVVYVAEQEEPIRRRVAVKVIKLGMDTRQVIARFEAERQALALMDHPNIARVLDAGATETGRPYFVMELVRGIKITDYCDQNHLSTEARLKLFVQVCHAVQHAHQKGIIHRDIKPSNILVMLADDVAVPKMIDFGIAKAIGERLTDKTVYTQFQQFIGTPTYMSPEQAGISGLDVDTRSDIYALGVLLYELLTGRTPFETKDLAQRGVEEILRCIREEEPPKPSTRLSRLEQKEQTTTAQRRATEAPKLIRSLRGDLDWIVMKCLEKDRKRRYETASNLAMDVERHLDDEPVLARPPSTAYRVQKFVRRNKPIVGAAAAVATALVLGIVVSTWQAARATRAEREQSRLRVIAQANERKAVAAEANEVQQRQRAEADEKRARMEAAKSRQVAGFLKDMLAGVGPSVALGRDTTMLREILDKTAAKVGQELTNQPPVEAELRQTIGEVYQGLGRYEEAETMLVRALALRRQVLGDENPEVAASLQALATVLRWQGKLAEAEKMQRDALNMRRKLLGAENLEVASSLSDLANVLRDQGKATEAEDLHRQALAMRRSLLGNSRPEIADSLSGLAAALWSQDKLTEAEATYREALAVQRKVLSDDHPDLTRTLNNLAIVLWKQDKCPEAERLCREALEMQRRLLGQDRPPMAYPLNNLALALWSQGKLNEAETACREAMRILRTAWGNEHPVLARSLCTLGLVLEAEGKLAEAETAESEALAMQRKLLGQEHPDVADSLHILGAIKEDQGNLAAAGDLLREALAMRRKLLGPGHASLIDLLVDLGRVVRDQGKVAEAEALAGECMAICEDRADDWRKFRAWSLMGSVRLRQKNFVEAERLLLSGYQGLKERAERIPPPGPRSIMETRECLVQLYEATGRPAEAAQWRNKQTEPQK